MQEFLIRLFHMSYQASIVICVVLIVRLLFLAVKIPKKYSYILWAIPFIRLICPWSLESVFSLLPRHTAPVTENSLQRGIYYIQSASQSVNQRLAETNLISTLRVEGAESVHSISYIFVILSAIWLVGLLILFVYSIAAYWKIKKKLVCSICIKDNVYFADYIRTPFVFGVIRPKIYLPSGMQEYGIEYVLAHEQIHIQRKDYIIKIITFFITCVHWFNPLAWIAFIFMSRDMEMSCDEAVMERLGEECRQNYATALFEMTTGRNRIAGMPLSFAEGNIKKRILNIMKYQKSMVIMTILAIVAIAILAVSLLTDPKKEQITEVDIVPPTIEEDSWFGADGPQLDYSGNSKIIFRVSGGLYVYSLQENQMIGAVDLIAIGCDATQGDNYCEVHVSKEGQKVYLHPVNDKEMFVYDVEKNKLFQQKYHLDGIELFNNLCDTSDILISDDDCYRPIYSVRFQGIRPPTYSNTIPERTFDVLPYNTDEYYGYLECVGGVSGGIENLQYVEGNGEWEFNRTYLMFEAYGTKMTASDRILKQGKYVLQYPKGDAWMVPYIDIDQENHFSLVVNPAMSYLPNGTCYYDRYSRTLTLMTDNAQDHYVFTLEGDTLIFHKNKSSSIPMMADSIPIGDGAMFKYTEDRDDIFTYIDGASLNSNFTILK